MAGVCHNRVRFSVRSVPRWGKVVTSGMFRRWALNGVPFVITKCQFYLARGIFADRLTSFLSSRVPSFPRSPFPCSSPSSFLLHTPEMPQTGGAAAKSRRRFGDRGARERPPRSGRAGAEVAALEAGPGPGAPRPARPNLRRFTRRCGRETERKEPRESKPFCSSDRNGCRMRGGWGAGPPLWGLRAPPCPPRRGRKVLRSRAGCRPRLAAPYPRASTLIAATTPLRLHQPPPNRAI